MGIWNHTVKLITIESKKELIIITFLEPSDDENIPYKNFSDAAKVVLKETYLSYPRKKKKLLVGIQLKRKKVNKNSMKLEEESKRGIIHKIQKQIFPGEDEQRKSCLFQKIN